MDPPETTECLDPAPPRRAFALLFTLPALLCSALAVGFVVFFIGSSSITNPISVNSRCKIVSSSVDLRSTKVCELGLLNYKAKHVFYPFERKKFRCRYDYYWASVFKVEYKDHSGHTRVALAETPNEVLPHNCRPNFGAAWLTKDKFKVNETYECWYTFGISKVNIYDDSFFNCQANDPSTIEMLRRYSILSEKILRSWFAGMTRSRVWRLEVIAGVISGFSTSLISITLFRLLCRMKSSMRVPPLAVCIAWLKRVCFFVAYFSFAGWLAIQYGKRLGLPEIYGVQK